jgi:hypothetical protein
LFGRAQFAIFSRMMNATMHAALFARPVIWSWRRIDAGLYGPPVRRGGRAVWVPLAAVEARHGVRFSPAQLRAVGIVPISEAIQEVAA